MEVELLRSLRCSCSVLKLEPLRGVGLQVVFCAAVLQFLLLPFPAAVSSSDCYVFHCGCRSRCHCCCIVAIAFAIPVFYLSLLLLESWLLLYCCDGCSLCRCRRRSSSSALSCVVLFSHLGILLVLVLLLSLSSSVDIYVGT